MCSLGLELRFRHTGHVLTSFLRALCTQYRLLSLLTEQVERASEPREIAVSRVHTGLKVWD